MSESGLVRKVTSHPLISPLFLPAILFSIAEGLLIPTLPLFAGELGCSYGIIGLVIAGESLGMLIADIPSGLLLRRLGEKQAMVLGFSLMACSTFALVGVRTVPLFLFCRLLTGIGVSFYNISRLAYIANEVKVANRGRVSAAFGGFKRIGAFIGPLVGGAIGMSAAIDMLLFYPAGYVMDHFGRKHAVISSMLVFAVGLAAIPLAFNFWSLLFVGILIGFGNGLGSGTMLTLGADLSYKERRGEFLGLWFLIGNFGAAIGPLIAGTVATILILEASA